MFHRTYGETKDCKGCRFWSEMLAQAGGDIEGVYAMCINSKSYFSGKYTSAESNCKEWADGHDGAVDEPGSDPLRYEDQS